MTDIIPAADLAAMRQRCEAADAEGVTNEEAFEWMRHARTDMPRLLRYVAWLERQVAYQALLLEPWSESSGECWQCHEARRGMQHTNGRCRCTAEWKKKLAEAKP